MTYAPVSVTPPRARGPLRALHVYSGNLFGGIERVFMVYTKHTRPDLWEPEYALCFDGVLRSEFKKAGVAHHDLGPVRLRSPRSVSRARTRLSHLLDERRYDVVVTYSVWSQSLAAPVARRHRVPMALHLHDAANGTHWLERLAKRWPPDVVVCNSEYTRRTLPKLYPHVPSLVVYNPVDLPRNVADATNRARVRATLSTTSTDVVILQASRMEEWKGQRLLLQSLAQLRPELPWTCWIAGGAQRPDERRYTSRLQSLATSLGIAPRVRFLGHRSDIPALMNAADILCQPNEGPEPFGIAFVEALNSSLPVITSAMGGAQEVINERCGILTSPDTAAVALALETLIQQPDLRAQLGANGVERAHTLCDPVRQMEALVNAFAMARPPALDTREAALLSNGASDEAIRKALVRRLRETDATLSTIVDLGCGRGAMASRLRGSYDRYVGCDLILYDGFPASRDVQFVAADLNRTPYPIPTSSADTVMSTETIEHLENPRAFVRELVRIAKPGGHVIFTTPNQLSILSKFSLVMKNQFNAFQEAPGLYPSHITALVELDLVRICRECGLEDIEVRFSDSGRIPFSRHHWPSAVGFRGRAFSDNVILSARKAGAPPNAVPAVIP